MNESLSLKTMSEIELQAYLTEVWKKQLKIEELSVDDDFLKLGGQSIDMFRMLTRVESDFDCEIDFDEFFEDTRLRILLKILMDLKSTN